MTNDKQQNVTAAVLADLAPTGRLRAAINLGNAVLAQSRDGKLGGVTVELARELARRLDVEVVFTAHDAAGKVVDAVSRGEWDLAFLAIDPQRATEIIFSAPYVLIEGAYLVRDASSLQANADVDRAGVRIASVPGAAYDLFLARAIKNAEFVRRSNGPDAIQLFLDGGADAVAGIRQVVEATAREHGGLRVLRPSVMAIRQAVAVPIGRTAGAAYVQEFIEEMKASGFVRDALDRSGQAEADVAPASGLSS